MQLAGFAPAFTLSLGDSERSRKPPMPIASVVMDKPRKKRKSQATSLRHTLNEIELNGETPSLKEELQFKFARLKLSEGELEESYKILGICNSITIDYNLRENYEIYFWVGRIAELKDEFEKAKTTYEMALRRCKDNPLLIPRNEIIEAIERVKTKI